MHHPNVTSFAVLSHPIITTNNSPPPQLSYSFVKDRHAKVNDYGHCKHNFVLKILINMKMNYKNTFFLNKTSVWL